jgi:hypothetical protein
MERIFIMKNTLLEFLTKNNFYGGKKFRIKMPILMFRNII